MRELKNIVERAVLMGNPPTIEKADLLTSALGEPTPDPNKAGSSSGVVKNAASEPERFEPISLKEMENRLILKTLKFYSWNKSKTAKALGIERTTLDRKIALYNIMRD